MSETIQLFNEVTSCEEFQEVVVENKKSFWGERIGDCSFGGAGGKAILLNTPNGKEFVSYEQAYNGKGKFGKLLNAFFFGASEEDKLSVTDILNLIDENLSDSDVMLLINTLKKEDAPQKLTIGDVFGGASHQGVNVQEYYDSALEQFKDRLSKVRDEDMAMAKSEIMAFAICEYYNQQYDFMKYDFDVESDAVHVVWTSKSDMGYLRHYAGDQYILFTTRYVDALAKQVEIKGESRLEIRLIV